jgi:hypothetical protein
VNDVVASWSIPWHELQRSLAAGIGIAALGCNTPVNSPPLLKSSSGPVGSWLARAHTRAHLVTPRRKITAA